MGKKPTRGRKLPPLRWRRTRISDWRQRAKMTLQDVADALTASGIALDRVSIVRIEGGKQMPTIEALEAMAKLFKTDVDSMLNYTPEQAKQLVEFKELAPKDQEKALKIARISTEEAE